MENITLSEEVIETAKKRAAGQSYAHLFKSFKAIGVDNYFVKVSNHKRTYTSVNGEKLILPPDMPEFEPAETFELEAVKAAIKKIQEGSIDYHAFLKEIGDAGIHTYVADITGMKVIYQGPNSEYEYEELIPEV
jgi:uncharacterized protein YbcV (DUF1398 family)